MIHVIGDSHVYLFRNGEYKLYWLGPITAYNLISPLSSTNSNQRLLEIINNISLDSEIILSAGEIDCRIHIYYQYKKDNERHPIQEYISKTIDRYIHILQYIQNTHQTLFVLGIPPVGTEENIYNYEWYAPPIIRASIYHAFNKTLQERCNTFNIKYIDVYSKTADSDGCILQEYTDDGVHLNKNALPLVEDILKKIGIIV